MECIYIYIYNRSYVFVLGDIMVDYSYVECTSACLQALHLFRMYYAEYRSDDIE